MADGGIEDMTEKRNYGIDLLRIVSMLFIVMLHTLTHGGIADAVKGTKSSILVNLLLTIVWCGVDIFAIISGFVGINHKSGHRLADFVFLWFRVAFYSGVIALILKFSGAEDLNLLNSIKWFAPISNGSYWYYTSYVFVFLLAPALNYLVIKSDSSKIKLYILIGLFLLYLSHTISGIFSPALLLYLYFMGSVIGKYKLNERIENKALWVILISLILITWIWKICIRNVSLSELWLRYDSPTIIGMAACFVMIFAKLTVRNYRRIIYITPSVFSVYLINDHRLIRNNFILNKFSFVSNLNTLIILFLVIGFSIIFLICAIAVDLVRRKVEKVFRIKDLTFFIEKKTITFSMWICEKAKQLLRV